MICNLTRHARDRARVRGIAIDAVDAAIDYGQHRSTRGADVYTLGWRQVDFHRRHGLDLSRWAGVEVVCARDGSVMTVYRNVNDRAMGGGRRAEGRRRSDRGGTRPDARRREITDSRRASSDGRSSR
jgi:hypothetical protein